MKKVKLLMLILSAFFAFGIQSASAQYVDAATAKTRVYDKIMQLSQEMNDARQASNEPLYYETKTKYNYYEGIMLGFKQKLSIEDALDQTRVVIATKTIQEIDITAAVAPKDAQLMRDLREEAEQLLKI